MTTKRIVTQSCQGIYIYIYLWIFFLNLELKQSLYYVNKLPSGDTRGFNYYLSHIAAKKNSFLSRFKASIIPLSINLTTFESLLPSLVFRKKIAAFHF